MTGEHYTGVSETTANNRMPRYRDLRDVLLVLRALVLARKAQQVRRRPVRDVVTELGSTHGIVNPRSAEQAVRAATRAGIRYARWFGGLDTCLTRSLVAGALLSPNHDVELNMGCRTPNGEALVDGHAWLLVDGRRVDATAQAQNEEPYTTVVTLPFRRALVEDDLESNR
ncbi:MAG: lasso peptide biosynthesis B2 protein [bacterium]|nr:lasso peptide biosynthesis B2 protein [bacterium]